MDTRYTLELTGCTASCRYKHPGKQFQTGLYQRVISRAGNNWRGCRFEDQWKGNKSNDSDKKRKTRNWNSQLLSFEVGVSAFTHLGRYMTSNNNGTEQVQCRITAAKTADFPLVPLLKKKSHTRTQNPHPTCCSVCNTWTLSHSVAQMIGSFERNILRRIHGPAQINGVKKCRNCIWNNHFQWLLYNIHVYHFY